MLTCTYFIPVKLGLEVLKEEYAVAVYLQDGRVAIFPDIMVGEESFSYENRMLLRRRDNYYELLDLESRYSYILSASENGEVDPFGLARMPLWMKTRQGWQRHHLIPASLLDKFPILRNSGMNLNGATNMTYLPVAEGIDLANPKSSLHYGWNDAHKMYNEYMSQELEALTKMAAENNWDESRIQQEIRNLQSDTKSSLKGGTLKCH